MLWPLCAFIGINAILFNPYNIPLFSFTHKKSKANRGEVTGLCFHGEQCKHLATRHSSTAPLHSAANVAIWEVGLKKRSIVGQIVWRSRKTPNDEVLPLWLVRISVEKNTGKTRAFNNIDDRLGGLLGTSKHHYFVLTKILCYQYYYHQFIHETDAPKFWIVCSNANKCKCHSKKCPSDFKNCSLNNYATLFPT